MTLDPIAAQNIADDRVREAYALVARLECYLAACVARLGQHVVLEQDELRHAILINGLDLTSRELPGAFPLVKYATGSKPHDSDEPIADDYPPRQSHLEPTPAYQPPPMSH